MQYCHKNNHLNVENMGVKYLNIYFTTGDCAYFEI